MFGIEKHYTIQDARGNPVQVQVRRDKRLQKTSRWERLPDGSLLLRVPYRFPKHHVSSLLEQVAKQMGKIDLVRSRRTDADLQHRAEQVNRKYFKGQIQWNAIRWVSNMQSRLGSCTRGGATDGEIRISDKIKNWPDWVVDYVIAHEILHRRYPNHSEDFWNELKTAYPQTERARGFIHGVGFIAGHPLEDD